MHLAEWTNKKERLLIVYQACSTCVRNTCCPVKDYKSVKDYKKLCLKMRTINFKRYTVDYL